MQLGQDDTQTSLRCFAYFYGKQVFPNLVLIALIISEKGNNNNNTLEFISGKLQYNTISVGTLDKTISQRKVALQNNYISFIILFFTDLVFNRQKWIGAI